MQHKGLKCMGQIHLLCNAIEEFGLLLIVGLFQSLCDFSVQCLSEEGMEQPSTMLGIY